MMSNSKPWKTSSNTNDPAKGITTENNTRGNKKDANAEQSSAASNVKIITPKRYSFDDNGGGYQGL